jgi:FAD/FMN-containing dehydrogenase
MNREAFLAELATRLGAANVLPGHGAGDLSAYTRDWRGRYHGQALAVALPASTDQVAAVVRLCAQHQVPIVTQGGNTGLVGGSVPDSSGQQLLLSLKRLNQTLTVDAANATLTAQAGCTLAQAQAAAAQAGFVLPLSLASEGSATIGGVLATNAGGTQVLRFGTARALCLGLEVVMAHGDVWRNLGGLRKDNTGYALDALMVGSEGTLGIITAATLKLSPQPAATLTALAQVPDLNAALALLKRAQQHLGPGLTAFEVMNACAQRLLAEHYPELTFPLKPPSGPSGPELDAAAPWWVLMEQSDTESEAHAAARFEALMQDALRCEEVQDAVVAQSLAQAQGLWHLRESIPLAQARAGLNIKHDISLPISRIAEFVAQTDARLAQGWPGATVVNFGHLGDGNLHYNLQAPPGVHAATFLAEHEAAVNAVVFDAVCAFGGSISAEHGIGVLKRQELAQRKDPVALATMRAIKQALDPLNLLNPGRVLEL